MTTSPEDLSGEVKQRGQDDNSEDHDDDHDDELQKAWLTLTQAWCSIGSGSCQIMPGDNCHSFRCCRNLGAIEVKLVVLKGIMNLFLCISMAN